MKGEYVSDVREIRRRAREHIEQGAVTAAYGADRATVVKLLNDALATELVCVLRYKRHYYMAKGLTSAAIAAEFAEHAMEELEHADRISERIVQLEGEPDYDPSGLAARSHSEYQESAELVEMIREDLVAERVAIESYSMMIRYFGDQDPTSRRLMEEILAKEEEHANDLSDLLSRLDGHFDGGDGGRRRGRRSEH